MKRKLALLLALVLLLTVFTTACGKKENPTVGEEETEEEPVEENTNAEPTEPTGQITIGNTTELTGDWEPYFQNNAADNDVYNFITGYSTVDMTFDGKYLINDTVVEKHEVTENDDGSKTYAFTIKDGLTYDDGSPITALDYVSDYMFWSSPVVGEMGGDNTSGQYLKGWKEYSTGNAKEFIGVNLIDEKTFAFTIDAENIPYFFELTLVSASPLKLSFWTDDTVEIKDDGNGCYFSDNFTKDNFEERINKARFESYPSTGPYKVVSYDEASKTAVLEVNDKFLGNYEGRKPLIKTVIYKKVTNETAMDELATGGVDLLSGMASGDEINAGLDLVEKGGYSFTEYPRAGYGKLELICDHGPTEDVNVRKAIAHLIDRNDFAKAFTGGFGTVVNGPYGEAMWFYQETKAELNSKLDQYPYSPEKAIALLEESGWIYDKNGNEYKEGIRYKKLEDGTLMPLVIEWASTEQNEVSDLLVIKLQENPDVASAGMKINQTVMTFGELLNYLYRDGSKDAKYGVPTYHMFNLGTGFTPRYDLSVTYTTDPDLIKQGLNSNHIIDKDLEKYAKEMVLTDPDDKDGFKKKFVDFIVRWNELLPDIPLYSNIYHDFYTDKLQNYNMNSLIKIPDAILYSYVTE